jgi:hypothetical protein
MASNDPDFERKAADIIGLYLHPPQHAAVFCVDEKSLGLIGNSEADLRHASRMLPDRGIFDKQTRRKSLVSAATRLWRKNPEGTLESRMGFRRKCGCDGKWQVVGAGQA